MQLERIECKAAFTTDDTGMIEGKAWDFATPDRVGDVIEPQAFASAIGKTLPMLYGHDRPVGVWSNIAVDGEGLKVKGRLLVEDVPEAKSARALVRAGGVTGLSVGFVTKKSAPRKGGGRTISDLDLIEVSIVAVPAHAAARITNAKDLQSMTTETIERPEVKPEAKADPVIDTKAIDAITARVADLETKLARPNIQSKKDDEPSAETKAFASYLRQGDRAPAEELKTLVVSSDPQGGYLAPTEMSTEFIRDLVEYSPIRGLATVRNTGSPAVSYPKRIGATNAKWKGEAQAQEGSEPTFGQVEIPAREINTFVDISNQLLADSAGVAEAEVRMALSEDFGLKEGTSFLKGSGPLEPEGILNAAGVTVVPTGNASTLGTNPADLLIDVMYDLPAGYRGRSTWLMNSKTLAAARKWKDGTTGTYLWQPAYQAGQPETILGRPVVECPDMDDVGAGTTPIILGDIATGYRILDRIGLSILVNPYLLATNGVTRIHATRRVGGAVVQPAALRKVVCKTA